MPELPEVETVRCGLEPVLAGRRLLWARAFRPDLRWPLPPRFAETLEGALVLRVRRRSKYLLIDLAEPAGEASAAPLTWMAHLGMSGRFVIIDDSGERLPGSFTLGPNEAAARRETHDHVMVATEAARIVYHDPRRFGAMDLWATSELDAHPSMASLGPEPLSDAFEPAHLLERLRGRRTAIKSALLDQRNVAGLGNIYVCEALWRAGVSPERHAGALSTEETALLVAQIKAVLTDAIAAGGSSLKDYRRADGELGYFQHAFAVYGRAGERCVRPGCDGDVHRFAQSGRSTFFCPKCQR